MNVSIDPAFSHVSQNAIKVIGVPNQTPELASESNIVLSFTVSLSHCQSGYFLMVFNVFVLLIVTHLPSSPP